MLVCNKSRVKNDFLHDTPHNYMETNAGTVLSSSKCTMYKLLQEKNILMAISPVRKNEAGSSMI